MSELDALRIREDVLQAMFWMSSEGLGDEPTCEQLARFVAIPPDQLEVHLQRFLDERWITSTPGGGWVASERGKQLGREGFAEEFQGLTGSGHGECDADCWCHESGDEAARCHEERHQGHAH